MLAKFCLISLLILKCFQCQSVSSDSSSTITYYQTSDVDQPDGNGHILPRINFCGIDNKGNVIDHTWLARLKYANDQFGCGGALINSRYVLTAASCVTGEVVDKFGELKSVTLYENSGNRLTTLYEIEWIVLNTDFVSNYLHGKNDVALIRLAKIVSDSGSIPICVNGFVTPDEANDPYVEGWGQNIQGTQSSIRQILRLKYVNSLTCHGLLSPFGYQLHPNDVCTSLNENDYHEICPLEGGGVLIHKQQSRWWLVGLGSYNTDCGHHVIPGVFTQIRAIYQWITNNMSP